MAAVWPPESSRFYYKQVGDKKTRMSALTVIDLFCGVGGLSLGAARAGLSVRGVVDVDSKPLDVHHRNFPGTRHMCADIAGLTGRSLKSCLGLNRMDGIIGSPPCQGFSSIGRHDRRDARNNLFVDFFRLVSEIRPKFFLAENVPGIMHRAYEGIRERARSFVEQKYVVLPHMVLAAHKYGAPTTRERVFFIGFRKDVVDPPEPEIFKPDPDRTGTVHVGDALRGLPAKIDPHHQTEELGWRVAGEPGATRYYVQRIRKRVPPGVGDRSALKRLRTRREASGFMGTVHSPEVAGRYAALRAGEYDPVSRSSRLDTNGFCPTIRAGTGPDHGSFQAVRPIHPTEPRVITVREAARLQGFPDWFMFHPTKWHSFRQIGNSVSPILAEHVLSVITKAFGSTGYGRRNR